MFHASNGQMDSNTHQQELSNGSIVVASSNVGNTMMVQSLLNTDNSAKNNQQLQQLLSMSSSPNTSNNVIMTSSAQSLSKQSQLATPNSNTQLTALGPSDSHMPLSVNNLQMGFSGVTLQASTGQSGLQNVVGHQTLSSNASLLAQIASQNQHQQLMQQQQQQRARFINPPQHAAVRLGGISTQPAVVPNVTSNGTTSGQVTGSAPSVTTDPDKRRLIQQQLVLLLHAHRCQRTEADNNVVNGRDACKLPHCKTMRNVLNHMSSCSDGKNCQVPHCASSRQILNHWKNCTSKDCPVCEPLKAQTQMRQGVAAAAAAQRPVEAITLQQQVASRQLVAPGHNVAQLSVQGMTSPSLNRPAVGMQVGSLQMPSPGGNFSGLPCTSANLAVSVQNHFVTTVTSGSTANGSSSLNEQLTLPTQIKNWHNQVTNEMRQHLVRRIVQTIFPAPDPSAYKDPRMNNLIEYAKKVEKDMYNVANAKEEYFHLLAEKCYKIHKELEEKRRSRQAVGGVVAVAGISAPGIIAQGLPTSLNTMKPPQPPMGPPSFSNGPRPNNGAPVGTLGGPAVTSCSGSSPSLNRTGNDPFSMMPMTPGSISQVSRGSFPSVANIDAGLNAAQQETEKLFNKALQSEYQRQDGSTDSDQISETVAMSDLGIQQSGGVSNLPDGALVSGEVKVEIKSEPYDNVDNSLVIRSVNVSNNANLIPVKCEVKSEPAEICISNSNAGVINNSLVGTTSTSGGGVIDSSVAVQMKSSPSVAGTTPIGVVKVTGPRNLKKWSREDLIRAFYPVYEKLYKAEPDSVPFQKPVDYVVLNIPDYPDIVKTPMDLSTIRSKLDQGVYKDPWEVTDDFHLMFNNAWAYNKKTSRVYKMCTKLNESFLVDIDKVMQKLGFCCGHEYVFEPKGLYCFSQNVCCIPRDATYYCYKNREKSRLVCDRYIFCENCYNKSDTTIEVAEDPSEPGVPIPKADFEKLKNNIKEPELFVNCKECNRKFHKICALHMNEIWTSGYTCKNCLNELGLKRKENKYTAKRLPSNKLSSYLERRVNDYLRKKEAGAGEVIVRVLASSDKVCEVKPGMRARYTETGEMPESFPYRAKAIFAFEDVEGQDVCFFGLHVQEYGSECPAPNTRRVYISYLDSVHFFQPKQFRTDVYHEILIGYLDYVKKLGYTQAHIWACPPSEGDDYIFHCHPPEQRIPKPKRLQEWYKKMLDKALMERIVIDYKDVLRYALENNMTSPTEIAYFEGDFWPGSLEESIKEIEAEEQKRRAEEEALAAQAAQEEADDDIEAEVEIQLVEGCSSTSASSKHNNKLVSKKATKRKVKKNVGGTNKRKKLSAIPHGGEGNQLSAKFYETMEKHKEVFFVIRLHSHVNSANLESIQDPDPLVQCDLMDGRDNLLCLAREKHLEFSSHRRCMYSSLHILYELHTEGHRSSFTFNCNHCNAQIETRYHCQECEDFDLCTKCYIAKVHPHRMEKLGFGIDDGGSSEDGMANPQESKRVSIERCIKSLVHACQCRDANCRIHTCIKMKRVLFHTKNCTKKSNNGCSLCKQLIALCCYHAKFCQEVRCNVPFCLNIKYRLRQQQLQQRLQQAQMLRRRMATMQRGMSVPTSGLPASSTVPSQMIPLQSQPDVVAVATPQPEGAASNQSVLSQQQISLYQQSSSNQAALDAALRVQTQAAVQQRRCTTTTPQVVSLVQGQLRPTNNIVPQPPPTPNNLWQSSPASTMQRLPSAQPAPGNAAAMLVQQQQQQQQQQRQAQIHSILNSLNNNLRSAKTSEEFTKIQTIIDQVRNNPQLALARIQQARTAQQIQAQNAAQVQQQQTVSGGPWVTTNRLPASQPTNNAQLSQRGPGVVSSVRATTLPGGPSQQQQQMFQQQQQNQRLQAAQAAAHGVRMQQQQLVQQPNNMDQIIMSQLTGNCNVISGAGQVGVGGVQRIIMQSGGGGVVMNDGQNSVHTPPDPSGALTSADKLANFVEKL